MTNTNRTTSPSIPLTNPVPLPRSSPLATGTLTDVTRTNATQGLGGSLLTTISDIEYATLSLHGEAAAAAAKEAAVTAVLNRQADARDLGALHVLLVAQRDNLHAALATGTPQSFVARWYDEWDEAAREFTPGW